jgi:hypothetical protein
VRFYLGTHVPRWMGYPEFAGVPLFISARRLRDQKRWKPAGAPWALDSGGFTELSMHGRWTVTAGEYVADVRRWFDMIGPAEWCAPQDWMCEPHMVAKTGLSVAEHQRRTVANYLELRARAPDLPFVPVLQGWAFEDYTRHIEDYRDAGVDLAALPLVGVGSVCRRQATGMAESLMRELHGRGIRAHGFGFKIDGLRRCAKYMASADSMAWSRQARWSAPLPGCTHKSCANCKRYAIQWRGKVLAAVAEGSRFDPQLCLW